MCRRDPGSRCWSSIHIVLMDEMKKRYVPAWVRDDPEVLAGWLSINWEAEAKLYDELGRRAPRENQVVFTGRSNRPKR
jgi:hypothetical protein